MSGDKENKAFRYFLGIVAILGGLGGLAALYVVDVPEGNREPLLLALGIVLGWGSTVVGFEYGSSPAGREAATAGINASVEMAKTTAKTAETLAQKQMDAPQPVEVVNTPDQPAIVQEVTAPPVADDRPDYAR
jgi:hypothetical protein